MIAIAVEEPSQAGEVRRAAALLADRVGLGEEARGRAQIVATELAKNLLQHARGGQVLLRALDELAAPALEATSIDRGPGMDLERCLRDGYSTSGTPGTGLGAVTRLTQELHARSTSDGTIVVARVWDRAHPPPSRRPELGVVNVPQRGESVSGDGCAVRIEGERAALLVVDGLGHGEGAWDASRCALAAFREQPWLAPEEILRRCHAALAGTRGAAGAAILVEEGAIRFAGVGNVAAQVISPDGAAQMPVSHNGTLGFEARRFQEFTLSAPPGSLLVVWSDGLQSRLRIGGESGLLRLHASLVAGELYRLYERGRDDATCVVLRLPPGGSA